MNHVNPSKGVRRINFKAYKCLAGFLDLLINFFCYQLFNNFFFTYIKICKDSSAKYHQDNKNRLQKRAHENYQSLSKEGNEKQRKYKGERYKNLSADEKQRLVGCRKFCCRTRKNVYFMK